MLRNKISALFVKYKQSQPPKKKDKKAKRRRSFVNFASDITSTIEMIMQNQLAITKHRSEKVVINPDSRYFSHGKPTLKKRVSCISEEFDVDISSEDEPAFTNLPTLPKCNAKLKSIKRM